MVLNTFFNLLLELKDGDGEDFFEKKSECFFGLLESYRIFVLESVNLDDGGRTSVLSPFLFSGLFVIINQM